MARGPVLDLKSFRQRFDNDFYCFIFTLLFLVKSKNAGITQWSKQ